MADAPDNRGGVCFGFKKLAIEEKALNKEQIFFELRIKGNTYSQPPQGGSVNRRVRTDGVKEGNGYGALSKIHTRSR